MVKAVWKGVVIAESNETIIIEGNHYFPRESVKMELLTPTETTTVCPWKGVAHYYTISVDGEQNADAAWTYPEPKPAAKEITGYLAFWRGVRIEK